MKHIIGIDVGGTFLKLALLDSRLKIKDKRVINTAKLSGKTGLIDAIAGAVKGFITGHGLSNKDILGIGIGLPGPVDAQRGIVRFLPNIPGWKDVPLRALLSKKSGLPVFIDNDANLMALAEYKTGAAKGSVNAVCITLGTGVGGGLILDNKLFRGSTFAAGEIGHMPLNEEGPLCNCHGRACLERYVGNKRILERARSTFQKNISLEELSALSAKGDRSARKIWKETADKIGLCLASVVNLINPDCIVIGGGVANAGKIFFRDITAAMRSRAMATQGAHVRVLKARLGDDSGVIGAAILVKQKGKV